MTFKNDEDSTQRRCLPKASLDGYALSTVYDGGNTHGVRRAVFRRRDQIILLADGHTRKLVVKSEPTITPNGIARLSLREEAYANREWGANRFAGFPRDLAATRRFIEDYLVAPGVRLDTRPERTADRLPYVETGGPWQRLPTPYHWANAAGIYLPKERLNGQSLEEHVDMLAGQPHLILKPKIRRLSQNEVTHYSTLSSHLNSSI